MKTDAALDRAARALADEFDYGFVFDWDGLTADPGTEQLYDRDYWRHTAQKVIAAYSATPPSEDIFEGFQPVSPEVRAEVEAEWNESNPPSLESSEPEPTDNPESFSSGDANQRIATEGTGDDR